VEAWSGVGLRAPQGNVENNNTTGLVWRTSTAATTVWSLSSSGIVTADSLGQIGTLWVVLNSGDYLNSTTTQMLTENTSDGTMTLWWVASGTLQGINLGQHWQNISYVDSGNFLGNGVDDILVKNNVDNHMYLWWVGQNHEGSVHAEELKFAHEVEQLGALAAAEGSWVLRNDPSILTDHNSGRHRPGPRPGARLRWL
jgi:hypothetical protein